MEIKKPSEQVLKQIVFKVSAEFHELIKCMAAQKRLKMKDWILNSLLETIQREQARAENNRVLE